MIFNVILFPDFETLDIFGPVEIFGKIGDCTLRYFSEKGGIIKNTDNVEIITDPLDSLIIDKNDVLFIPGGLGTRTEINNKIFIEKIKLLASKSEYVLTVCTGSALIAKTGLLDSRKATSNKRSFDWVKESSANVLWIREARWVKDGKYYTSSGISAGMDMALGFIRDIFGLEEARRIAFRIEYNWQENESIDNFYKQ
ncbi:DJ-1/PfpI family protein [Prevotella sp. 10(H)]|uniref:DJ-1/PfpI family protein n=1 Tax=Prevotella sp. 10(H) TaxID=1158294 RepID=UPI0004A6C624|nr:DJ-1/PfpI family protein [Prevotella sp. 10(H)]